MRTRTMIRWSPAAILLIAGSAQSLQAGSPFPAVIELSSLDGTNGFVINGIDGGDVSGDSVSNAGDINGDGVDDLIIGAPSADPNGNSYAGESYVVFGGAGVGASGAIELSALDGTNGFVFNGIDEFDSSGHSVSSAGDVNGDGANDLIIGAPGADPNGNDRAGESYVVFGGAGVGASGVIELSALDGTDGFVINGIDEFDRSGGSVSSAGDVNGDGVDDLIIGARFANASYVVFGGAGVGASGVIELSALNGANGFVINGSGFSVSSAGDVNGDGADDLIIGAPFVTWDEDYPYSGQGYVVFGGTGVGASGALELSALDGDNGFFLNGRGDAAYSGWSVSDAGDVNGDGIDDLIIGAPYAEPRFDFSYSGESHVVFGGAGVGASGAIVLFLNGANGFDCNGIDELDYCGSSVSSAGDVNGDGVDDIIIGAFRADPNGNMEAGESYVVFGGAGVGASGVIELSALDGTNGFVINGIDANDRSGFTVSSTGDINGDGVDDLIIGAQNGDPNGNTDAGESYVIFGRCVLAEDLNGDDVVDSADLGILIRQFGMAGSEADLNGDGVVDMADLGILIGRFGMSCP